MDSTFLVFDLVGGQAGFQRERDSGSFVHPKLDDPEEAVGFIFEKTLNRFQRVMLRQIQRVASQ
jgi:hypothetical protein